MEKQPNPVPANNAQPSPEAYVPDTQKIVHRHLQDPNHQITEEELKSIRISTDHYDQEHKDMLDEVVAPDAAKKQSDAGDAMITPWDVTT